MPLYLQHQSYQQQNIKDPIIMIHGGAGPQDPKEKQATQSREIIQQICFALQAQESWQIPNIYQKQFQFNSLNSSQALQKAVQASFYLENEPMFNAGFGAALQEDGIARVSASLMDSRLQKFSAVMNVIEIKNPSLLAYYLQSKYFCVRDFLGSHQLADNLEFPRENLVVEKRLKIWREYKEKEQSQNRKVTGKTGTIGVVTIDSEQNLACITSTGGVGNEPIGRIGDTPTVAGNYCTKRVAISCTGYGEQILNQAIAVRIATRVEDGLTLKEAVSKTLTEAADKKYNLAIIAIAYNQKSAEIETCASCTNQYFVWGEVGENQIRTF